MVGLLVWSNGCHSIVASRNLSSGRPQFHLDDLTRSFARSWAFRHPRLVPSLSKVPPVAKGWGVKSTGLGSQEPKLSPEAKQLRANASLA